MFSLSLRGKPAELLVHVASAHIASSLKLRLKEAVAKIEGEAEHIVSVTGKGWDGNPFATADAKVEVKKAKD